MKNNNVDMLSGSVFKGILSLTMPIMIMNVAQSLFNLADMAILRAFNYESAVGAVGACTVLITLFTSLLIGIAAGANVVIARHVGAGKRARARSAIMTSVLFAVFSGIVLMIVGAIFAKDFLAFTNCDKILLDDATLYFKLYFCGIPFLMLYNFCASVLRALGDTKRPMYFLFIGCAVKLVFTVAFIRLTGKAIESVAIATIVSNFIACGLSFLALLKNKEFFVFNLREIRFDGKELKAILYNGVPAGLQSALYSFANVIITSVVNTFGPDATTGMSIANVYDGILYQICYAPSLAAIPFVAQNVGAGNLKRVKKTLLYSVLITAGFGASLGALSTIFSEWLSYRLSSSPEVVSFSMQKMVVVSSTYFICGINEVLGGALKGMGKPLAPAVTSLVYMCIFRFVWVYWIFPLVPNLSFLYTVWPVGWVLSIITLMFVYISGISKMKKMQILK